jgi:hypothetical protein
MTTATNVLPITEEAEAVIREFGVDPALLQKQDPASVIVMHTATDLARHRRIALDEAAKIAEDMRRIVETGRLPEHGQFATFTNANTAAQTLTSQMRVVSMSFLRASLLFRSA